MNNQPSLPYRACVGIMLLNKDGLVFTGHRIDSSTQAWQMPQGGIEDGEDITQAAFRELEEETGIPSKNIAVITQTSDWFYYDLPQRLLGKVWGGKYRGQKQIWFLMRYLGEDKDIDIKTHEPEFKAWKWLPPHTLPDVIVPFKKKLYEEVLEVFREKIPK